MAINDTTSYEPHYREQASGPKNLLRLAALLWRNILFIVLIGIICAALAFGVSLLIPNYYVATSQILLDPEGSRVLESDLPGQPRSVDSHVLNQQYIITSAQVLSRIVESEKLYDDPKFGAAKPFYPDKESRSNLALDALRKVISVDAAGRSYVVNVIVRSDSPQRAADLANLIANTYTQVRVEMNSDVLRRTGGGLAAQLDQLRKAVEDGDRAVQAYRAEHNLADIQGRPDVEQRIADANTEISRLSATVAESEALVAELNRARNDRQYLRSIPDTSLTPAIISLRARYQESREEESVQANSLGAQHPSLQAARARTQSLANILDEQLRNFATATSGNLERLKNQLTLLRTNANTLKTTLNSDEQTMVRLRELQRKLESDRAVYEAFLLRTKQLSEQQGTSSENPQIISSAEPPLRAAGPPRALITAGGGILGLILAAGLLILRDQFRGQQDEPKQLVRTPFVASGDGNGTVTLLPASDKVEAVAAPPAAHQPRLIREADTKALNAPTVEDFGGLAAFVSSHIKPAANHAILVVSTGPKNRAPYSAFNLAVEVSKLGRRVLLVDGATHDPLLTAMLLPEQSAAETEADDFYGVEAVPFLQFAPAYPQGEIAIRDPKDKNGDAFDLIVVDGGVAAKSRIRPSLRRDLAEVFLMQHEDDTGSVVIALVTLEESGMDDIKVLRMTRSGLQY
ncbi:Wzz/FepE/Etk N-terminal domain-containing protein [Agrobacterium sp. BA1120]|uniref:exopolysaccharide transport family protein n=1 Tax=Agrobacterium sp. BA1120 TaxID=3228927 RepID=UPI00336AC58D